MEEDTLLNYRTVIFMKRNRIYIYLSIILFISLWGCGKKEVIKQISAEERFALGMKEFQEENYLEAIEEFKLLTLQYPASKLADSAQFLMGECRFLREEYILAAYEYEILINTMPTSPLVGMARFKQASCYYELSPKSHLDQIYTKKAVNTYQEFLEYHPKDTLAPIAEQRIYELNTKLAKKDFENGMIYMYMEYYKSAIYYFDEVLEKYHDTPYAELALLKKSEAFMHRKRYYEAKEALDKFKGKYPESKYISEANKLELTLNNKLAEDSIIIK